MFKVYIDKNIKLSKNINFEIYLYKKYLKTHF